MAQITPTYISVAQMAAELGITVAEADELLRRNVVESRTLVVTESLRSYQGAAK